MNPEIELSDVFVGGADGVHTYRIPSLIFAPGGQARGGGTLLAFCEARKRSPRDASPTDLVLKRSADGGRTWQPMQVVVRAPGDQAIMNPSPVVDGGRIWLFCMNAHKTGRGRHRQLLLHSDDEGRTWSEPADITDEIKAGQDTFVPGPGVSIRTRGGRLVVPGCTNVYDDERNRTACHSRVIWSDDGGRSWRLGGPVDHPWTNESQVVELADGSLRINCRVQMPSSEHPKCRAGAISRDGGESWSAPELVRELNEAPCQAGLVRYGWADEDGVSRLIFSNPDAVPGPDGGSRTRMTVRLSFDEGATWPVSRLIDPGPSCYSCPARLPDGRIGLLYERGTEDWRERIGLARFGVEWLGDGADNEPRPLRAARVSKRGRRR